MNLFDAMEASKDHKMVDDLIAENRAILEELEQCKADKDFVWNLWRRLQSSQPDVTSVVSMVVTREKEKSEHKDKKVLEILQLKDEKIKELKENVLSAEDESHYCKTRYHDLLLENEELKQKMDEKQSEFSTKEKELRDENNYLSCLLKAHQEQKKADEENVKENLDRITEEKNELKIRIVDLEKQVSDFSEEKLNMASAISANASLEEKIKALEVEVEDLTMKSAEVAKTCDEAELKLNDKENEVKEQLEMLSEKVVKIAELERELGAMTSELGGARESYKRATAQMSEQARVIQHYKEVQQKNQVAATSREQEYRKEVASLQKSVTDLQSRCSALQEKQTKLLQENGALKESSAKLQEDLKVKELIIGELKDTMREGIRSVDVSKREGRLNDSDKGDDWVPVKVRTNGANDPQSRRDQDFDRLGKGPSGELINNEPSSNVEESGSEVAFEETKSTKRRLYKLTALGELENRLSENRAMINGLKKLLELKEAELVETRRAHAQRQQRYRMLKENYQLVLEQIKTYEERSDGLETGREAVLPERPEERELRHLDSDQVWKELAYYKHEYETLANERHEVLEEVDVLRVQQANNVANIQELRVQLSEEDAEKSEFLRKIAAKDDAFEVLRLEVEKGEDQLVSWKEKALKGQAISGELEEENQLLKQEMKALKGQNRSLTDEFNRLADEYSDIKRLYDDVAKEENRENKLTEKRIELREAATQTENDSGTIRMDREFAVQGVESLSSYDEQVKRIADRLLTSPPKEVGEQSATQGSDVTQRSEVIQAPVVTQGTQTDNIPRFIDSGINVNLDAEDVSSMDEEVAFDVKNSVKKGKDPVRPQESPQVKSIIKKTPRRNEWASAKQRILSLTQEVSALRKSKDKAVKAMNLQKVEYESLQTEYSTLLAKLQLSRNSVQHLTDSLKMSERKNEQLIAELKERTEEGAKPSALSIAEWKRLEEELRMATMECIRLAGIVRTIGAENEQLRLKIKELLDSKARLDHVATQKKMLLEEMKAKVKEVEEKAKRDSEAAKNLEERLSQLKEREKTNKVRLETMELRLDNEMREKKKYHQQLSNCQEELKKKTQQLNRSQTLRNQAKIVVSEMEAAATMQLHGLANQSEATIASLQRKLDKARERTEEFQRFVRTLVEELLTRTRTVQRKIDELNEKQWRETSPTAVKEAQSKACSILNISSSDLESILEVSTVQKEEELKLRTEQEKAWIAEVESALRRQGTFAAPLVEVLLDLVDERVAVETKYAGS